MNQGSPSGGNDGSAARRRFTEALSVPVPTSVSAEAGTMIESGRQRLAAFDHDAPTPADAEEWKRTIAAANANLQPVVDQMLATSDAEVERIEIAGVSVARATPNELRHSDRAIIKLHGGGWVNLGGAYVDADAARSATDHGCVAYGVDYRMPPDHPFPVPLDDCVAVFRELAKSIDPARIAVAGTSAGANLAAALALKLRDEGHAMPGALGMFTPPVDLTFQGDSWETNFGLDQAIVAQVLPSVSIYANGHDLTHPYLSPINADLGQGFPPTFLQSGTRDRLLSDTVRMHRELLRAGVTAELHVWEAMPHGGFGGDAPEDQEMRRQFDQFLDKTLPA